MLKRFCLIVSAILLLAQNVYANELEISAKSALVMDAYSGTVLFEKNAYENRAIASTTKIMTCLIACESGRLSDTVRITQAMLDGCEGSLIYLEEGDEISLYDLVCGAMIASGNDAANAIACHISGSIKAFSVLMNEKALKLGMKSTKFTTPSGLDKAGNHSTAYDMALLSSYAVMNEELMKIASQKSAHISVNGEDRIIYNHNKLLNVSKNYIGLKTGFTERAGRCLVSAYKYSNNIIIVVSLGAPDDWQDHKRLVKYAKKCYKDISQRQDIEISVVGSEKSKVRCSCDYDLKTVGTITVKRYHYPFAYAPVRAGDTLGREEVYINKILVKTADIKAQEDVEYG